MRASNSNTRTHDATEQGWRQQDADWALVAPIAATASVTEARQTAGDNESTVPLSGYAVNQRCMCDDAIRLAH